MNYPTYDMNTPGDENIKKIIRDKLVHVIDDKDLVKTTHPNIINKYLVEKVQEELQEIVDSDLQDIEEYADLIQVVIDLARNNGITAKEIEEARIDKQYQKGGFRKGIFLKEK